MARPTDWIDTILDRDVLTATNGAVSLMTGVLPHDMRGMTVIRTILALGVQSTTVAGAWGTARVDIAIGVASQEAFGAGVLPDPNVANDKPPRGWVYRTSLLVSQNGTGHPVGHQVMADIRGARKIENGELYIIVHNTPLFATAFTINFSGLIRTLYKL